MEVIRNVVEKWKSDVSYNGNGFIKVKKESGHNFSSIIVFVIVFVILYAINSGEREF
jgi:hypothetical protein